jgi:hypothetical protein
MQSLLIYILLISEVPNFLYYPDICTHYYLICFLHMQSLLTYILLILYTVQYAVPISLYSSDIRRLYSPSLFLYMQSLLALFLAPPYLY